MKQYFESRMEQEWHDDPKGDIQNSGHSVQIEMACHESVLGLCNWWKAHANVSDATYLAVMQQDCILFAENCHFALSNSYFFSC